MTQIPAQAATAAAWPPGLCRGRPWGSRPLRRPGLAVVDRRLRQLPDRRDRGPGRWRINDAVAAVAGGLVAGAVIGAGQWPVGRRLLGDPLAWIAATAGGMGIGLLAGARLVDYGTSVGELAAIGACHHRGPARRGPTVPAPRSGGPLLGVGGGHAAAVGAGLDDHRRRRGWRRSSVRGLRCLRRRHRHGTAGGRRDRIAVRCGTDGQSADRERRTSGGFVRSLPRSRWELTVDAA
jgi:hypothetical protein